MFIKLLSNRKDQQQVKILTMNKSILNMIKIMIMKVKQDLHQ